MRVDVLLPRGDAVVLVPATRRLPTQAGARCPVAIARVAAPVGFGGALGVVPVRPWPARRKALDAATGGREP